MSNAVVEMLSQNTGLILAVITMIFGGGIGKLVSDKGKQSLVKELDEAKEATVKMAKTVAPELDLAYNIGIGRIPLDEMSLKKLKEGAAASWTDAVSLSKEVKDVLDQFAEKRGGLKP